MNYVCFNDNGRGKRVKITSKVKRNLMKQKYKHYIQIDFKDVLTVEFKDSVYTIPVKSIELKPVSSVDVVLFAPSRGLPLSFST